MSLDDAPQRALHGPLDGALAAWAAAVQLPDSAAAARYRQIVATPAPVLTGSVLAGPVLAGPVLPGPVLAGVPAPAVAAEPAMSPGLDPAWWRTFNADFAERLVISTRPSRQAA